MWLFFPLHFEVLVNYAKQIKTKQYYDKDLVIGNIHNVLPMGKKKQKNNCVQLFLLYFDKNKFGLNILLPAALQLFTWSNTMCVFLVTLCLNIRLAQVQQRIQLKVTHQWWGGYLQSGGHSNTVKCSTVTYYITACRRGLLATLSKPLPVCGSPSCLHERTFVVWSNWIQHHLLANKDEALDILPPLSVWLQSYKRKQQLIITCVPVCENFYSKLKWAQQKSSSCIGRR